MTPLPLRARLGLEVPSFARLVGSDARSVRRWEAGIARPCGSSAAVIAGLTEALDRDEGFAAVCRTTARVGGLAYLLVRLAADRREP